MQRASKAAEAEELARLSKAANLTRWVRCLPHSLPRKLFFYQSTALAVASAPVYTRLNSLRELSTLHSCFASLNNNEHASLDMRGPVYRLLSGHSADAAYRVSIAAASQVLLAAVKGDLTQTHWPQQQTMGPIALTRKWMVHQG